VHVKNLVDDYCWDIQDQSECSELIGFLSRDLLETNLVTLQIPGNQDSLIDKPTS
jgi:hypothetical protein